MHSPRVAGLILLLILGVAQGQEQTPPDVGYWGHSTAAVYRENGQLTTEALENVELLRAQANAQDYVTLWLTANVPFNPDTDAMSARQIAQQTKSVRDTLHDVLQPLIAAGLVRYVRERPRIEGPGRMVQANVIGLMRLVNDDRLLHIHGQ